MTLTIELTPEQEAVLQAQAQAAGIDATEYAKQLLASDLATERRPMTGAEMIAYWNKEGITGTFADRPDSQEYARYLRATCSSFSRPLHWYGRQNRTCSAPWPNTCPCAWLPASAWLTP